MNIGNIRGQMKLRYEGWQDDYEGSGFHLWTLLEAGHERYGSTLGETTLRRLGASDADFKNAVLSEAVEPRFWPDR